MDVSVCGSLELGVVEAFSVLSTLGTVEPNPPRLCGKYKWFGLP